MNNLYPIAITLPNWDYVKMAFAENLNQNIDAGINTAKMKKDIGAYLGVLGMTNDPLKDLRLAAKRSLGHVHLTFAMNVELDIMKFLVDSKITTSLEATNNDSYFMICTGSLDTWIEAAYDASQERQEYELRYLFNKIIIYFDNIGLKQIMNNYDKKPLKDKTFSLKRN